VKICQGPLPEGFRFQKEPHDIVDRSTQSAEIDRSHLNTRRSNIVFVLADELGTAESGRYGSTFNSATLTHRSLRQAAVEDTMRQ